MKNRKIYHIKKYIKLLLLSVIVFNIYAQNPDQAKILVDDGVNLHDKGDFEGALSKM